MCASEPLLAAPNSVASPSVSLFERRQHLRHAEDAAKKAPNHASPPKGLFLQKGFIPSVS
jgi:hypothetical protein